MTLSVLAYDSETGSIGGVAATGNLAVGAWVLRVSPGYGAVATQGTNVSTLWGEQALNMLTSEQNPEYVVQQIIGGDPGKQTRQLAVLNAQGESSVFTGEDNHQFKGSIASHNAVFTGNWLSGPDVLQAMAEAYAQNARAPFPVRLLEALSAGVESGSDSRGTLSAALLVKSIDCPPLDLRVDYHETPVDELKNLYQKATSSPYVEWTQQLPTIEEPNKC